MSRRLPGFDLVHHIATIPTRQAFVTDLDMTGEVPTIGADSLTDSAPDRQPWPQQPRLSGSGRGGRQDPPARNEGRHPSGRRAQSRSLSAAQAARPVPDDRTVEVPMVPAQAPPSEPQQAIVQSPDTPLNGHPASKTGPWPARPAPDDAAAEVWALVERAQAGDSSAFGQLYDRYVDTVFRFIYFRVGNRPLAEDLTSDTFLRALKRIGSFTWQGRDLGAWLVTIARNLVADHFKSGRYRLEVTTGDVLDADQADRGPEGSPELAVVDHITNVALLTAVNKLNPEQRECIVLRFLHGFSVAETAQAMRKNEGAIKALQYRAVRALHRLLPDGMAP